MTLRLVHLTPYRIREEGIRLFSGTFASSVVHGSYVFDRFW